MCIAFFNYRSHPKYKFILALNRDEFYDRKTQQAHIWKNPQDLMAGKDEVASGTWCGLNKKGHLAFLTNYRNPKLFNPNAFSRGKLILDFFETEENHFKDQLLQTHKQFNPFNMIFGNSDHLYFFSSQQNNLQKLTPGTYALSNDTLNTPWPKITHGLKKFSEILKSSPSIENDLLHFMQNQKTFPDETLPNTGLSLENERLLSSIFIKSPNYGTRSTTLILIDQSNKTTFLERTYQETSSADQSFYFSF